MRTETDKTKLYDRQLRLWQKDGQAALERARVVVVGSSTLASESLKNLVLPASSADPVSESYSAIFSRPPLSCGHVERSCGRRVLSHLCAVVGIGEFIVVDDALVADEDLRTNFFVRAADAGKSRAQSIVDNLCEMNPDVHGQALVKAPPEFIALSEQDGPEAELLGSATLVIVCAQPDEIVRALGARCWDANIPMVAACNAGFIAEIRTAVREHT
ncbi:NEDD8-activating enzyme E1 regulatory subunit, partial [Coemansia sp. RSA 2702]